MGKLLSHKLGRAALIVAVIAGVIPVTAVTAAPPAPVAVPAPAAPVPASVEDTLDPSRASRFIDTVAKLSFAPPPGWVAAPRTSLNPTSAPASPVFEVARFQMRVKDPALYAQPMPLTSGLVADAGAVLSVGIARLESELLELDIDPRVARAELGAQSGYVTFDESATYEGLVSYTRYFMARESDRRLVMQAVVPAEDWPQLEPAVMVAMRSLRADQAGPHGPVATPPAPPPPVLVSAPAVAAAAAEPAFDASAAKRFDILTRAKSVIGLPYVWGGNSTTGGMDCSSYVSWAWGVARYTTDSISAVSYNITKDELRPGDIMNLPTWSDPARYGHMRMFEAWANEARTLMWVYEETPPRVMHRVIAYDGRYQPMRLNGLTGSGPAPLVIAPPSAVERAEDNFGPAAAPRQPARATPHATPRPTLRATPRPTVRPTVRPTATPRRTATPRTR